MQNSKEQAGRNVRAKLYIKAEQNNQISNKKVYLEDIAKLYSHNHTVVAQLNRQVVMTIKSTEDMKYCISILKVIEIIHKQYPELEIINCGETDFVISYSTGEKTSKFLEYIKAIVVCAIVFFGGGFSIMTFNYDASIEDIFDKLYELVIGTAKVKGSIIEWGYCLGIIVGILVFYNHFSKFRVKSDPTPIQIEMRKYEKDMNEAVIADASRGGTTIDAD